jgi:hypothetical protein
MSKRLVTLTAVALVAGIGGYAVFLAAAPPERGLRADVKTSEAYRGPAAR